MIANITDQNFQSQVIDPGRTFFLLFSSPWCTTCTQITPLLDNLSKRYPQAGFGRIDISTNMVVPSEHNVLSIPSLIVFQGGKELTRFTTRLDEAELKAAAAQYS